MGLAKSLDRLSLIKQKRQPRLPLLLYEREAIETLCGPHASYLEADPLWGLLS